MGKTIKSLRRAVKAARDAAAEPIPKQKKYRIADRVVRCSHCDGELFEGGPAFAPMIIGFALQCVNCGHLEIFAREVDDV
jgi:hypothetical protein